MKIALVTARRDPFISPYDMDGGCVVLRNYIKELYKLGHEVSVFTRLEETSKYNDKKTNAKARMQGRYGSGKIIINKGITIYRIPFVSAFSKDATEQGQFIEARTFTESLEKYLKAEKFDIIHYFHLMSISGWLISKKKIPYLDKTLFSPLLLTNGRTFQFQVEKRLRLERTIFNKCRYIISQSAGEIKEIKKYYKINDKKLFKIPLGVDKNIFYPKDTFNFNRKNRIVIINPNSIRPQKRQLDLVAISNALKTAGIKCITLFVGNESDPSYVKRVQREITNNNLTFTKLKKFSAKNFDQVKADFIFLKGQKEAKLAPIIRYSDISIFTSQDEGFSLSMINCMACGTLPFCYDLPAYNDYLINGENAIAVPLARGTGGVTKALFNILKDKQLLLRLSKTSINVSNSFTWSVMMEKQLAIYRNIKNKKPIKSTASNGIKNWVNLGDGKIML